MDISHFSLLVWLLRRSEEHHLPATIATPCLTWRLFPSNFQLLPIKLQPTKEMPVIPISRFRNEPPPTRMNSSQVTRLVGKKNLVLLQETDSGTRESILRIWTISYHNLELLGAESTVGRTFSGRQTTRKTPSSKEVIWQHPVINGYQLPCDSIVAEVKKD